MQARLAAVIASLLVGSSAHAQTARDEQAQVIAAVQRLFDGMAKRDSVVLRAALLPGMHFVATNADSTPLAGVRMQSDSAFIRGIASRTQHLVERMWNPTVKVDGSIATLFTRYDFHIDGSFSHCGVDTATLVKTADGWRIADLVYTTQRANCPRAQDD